MHQPQLLQSASAVSKPQKKVFSLYLTNRAGLEPCSPTLRLTTNFKEWTLQCIKYSCVMNYGRSTHACNFSGLYKYRRPKISSSPAAI